jgi:hypothetical protein
MWCRRLRLLSPYGKLDRREAGKRRRATCLGTGRRTRRWRHGESFERHPQQESILANRKRQLGIAFESGRRQESDINRWIADPVAWRPKREFDAV